MGFHEPLDTTDQTHRVVTRTSVVSNDEGTGWVEVENTVVNVAMRYGTAVHVRIDGGILEQYAPQTLSTVRQLSRLRSNEEILMHGDFPEYRASLPDDVDTLMACLDPGGDDAWLARLFGTVELAVVAEDAWLYHSVPHHEHTREINAAVDGFLSDVDDALASIRGAAVFPIGPLVSWQADDCRYELVPEFERFRITEMNTTSSTAFSLGSLSSVYSNRERREIVLRWNESESGSPVVRGLKRFFGRSSTDPPTRIGVPDSETLDRVLAGFRTIATKLDYDYGIHD